MYEAVKEGNEAKVCELLAQRVQIEDKAFFRAALGPHVNILRSILSLVHSAINLRNKDGDSLLQLAMKYNRPENALCILKIANEKKRSIRFHITSDRDCVEFQDALRYKMLHVANEIRITMWQNEHFHWISEWNFRARRTILDQIPMDTFPLSSDHMVPLMDVLHEEQDAYDSTHAFMWKKLLDSDNFEALAYLREKCGLLLNNSRFVALYERCPSEIFAKMLPMRFPQEFVIDAALLFKRFNEANMRILTHFSSTYVKTSIPWNRIIQHKCPYILRPLFFVDSNTILRIHTNDLDIASFCDDEYMDTIRDIVHQCTWSLPWSIVRICPDSLLECLVNSNTRCYWNLHDRSLLVHRPFFLQMYCRIANRSIADLLRDIIGYQPSLTELQEALHWLDDERFEHTNQGDNFFCFLSVSCFRYLDTILSFRPKSVCMQTALCTKYMVIEPNRWGELLFPLDTLLERHGIDIVTKSDDRPSWKWDPSNPIIPSSRSLKRWGQYWLNDHLPTLEWLLKANRCEEFLPWDYDCPWLKTLPQRRGGSVDDDDSSSGYGEDEEEWIAKQWIGKHKVVGLWDEKTMKMAPLLIRYQIMPMEDILKACKYESEATIIVTSAKSSLDGWWHRWQEIARQMNQIFITDITPIILGYTEHHDQLNGYQIYYSEIMEGIFKHWHDFECLATDGKDDF